MFPFRHFSVYVMLNKCSLVQFQDIMLCKLIVNVHLLSEEKSWLSSV